MPNSNAQYFRESVLRMLNHGIHRAAKREYRLKNHARAEGFNDSPWELVDGDAEEKEERS